MKKITQLEPWYGSEEKKAMKEYLDSGGWLMEFKKTKEFEEMICKFTGAKYCSVVNNGTVSLFIGLKALGIGSGDEVIVPNITMAASPNSVILTGAKPVFVDIEEKSMCLDVKLVEKAINKKTKAVMHVSLNGRAGELDKLKKLCQSKKIHLVEDAAQAFGSYYRGKHLGTFSAFGSFSFSVPKVITTGQGGAVITNDKKIFDKVLKIKDFGRERSGEDHYIALGWNFKFTDLQAVIGIEQMKKLKWRLRRKKQMYRLYQKELKNTSAVNFPETNLKEVAPWFFDIKVPDNKKLQKYLKENGIGSRRIYPSLNSEPIYKVKGSFPVSKKIARQVLWLPSSSFLSDNQIKHICKTIKKFYE